VHSLAIGGTEQVVCDLARVFNDAEFHTSVCCLDELGRFGSELRQKGIQVHVLGRNPGLDLSITTRLRDLYQRQNVDLIHAHQYTPYFYAAAAALRAGLMPVVFTEHGRHWPDRLRIKRAVANQVLRLTTPAYTAVSEFTRKSMTNYERIPASAIRVIYNGIEIKEMLGDRIASEHRQRIRSKSGLSDKDLLVLSVGRMDPIKDFDTLIRAFAHITQQLPRAMLWIAGDGDSNYRKHLIQLVEKLDLTQKIKLLGVRRDINALLHACDLFVSSSITEATSMTILEAMTSGRAVVATRTGGNPELVTHEHSGILVPVGNVAAMGEAMRVLLNDPKRRERMGVTGQARVKETFSQKFTFAQYRDLYRSVSARNRRSSLKWMIKSPSASHI
jgi:glycosyltransferase involved in cell wall biosynthesis